MLKSITLNTAQLAAALVFSAKKDVRYYLQGVCIDVTQAGPRLVATDGCALGVLKSTLDFEYDGEDTQIIIPFDVVADIVKKAGKGACVTLAAVEDSYRVEGLGLTFKCLDGRFPDWRRVVTTMPALPDAENPQFDPELLGRFQEAAKLLGCRHGHVYVKHLNGAAQVQLPATELFLGLIMPRNMPKNFSPSSAESHRAAFV